MAPLSSSSSTPPQDGGRRGATIRSSLISRDLTISGDHATGGTADHFQRPDHGHLAHRSLHLPHGVDRAVDVYRPRPMAK